MSHVTQEEYEALVRGAKRATEMLMSRGYSRDEAVKRASDMAIQALRMKRSGVQPPSDLGQAEMSPIDVLAEQSKAAADVGIVKTIREAVSPWLWALSIAGSIMGLVNYRRIGAMYRKWRGKKQP